MIRPPLYVTRSQWQCNVRGCGAELEGSHCALLDVAAVEALLMGSKQACARHAGLSVLYEYGRAPPFGDVSH